ncbi:efflux RND transporter periplasmic adaptor subunit [Leeia sp.]|uniref:efflux RND transporter periplasmic adaptor subunit n=1 Tax=Leeia sp. TaxID=2884678 RepID=UPI0035AE1DC4
MLFNSSEPGDPQQTVSPRQMRPLAWATLGGLAMMTALLGACGQSGQEKPAAPPPRPALAVTVTQPTVVNMPDIIRANGSIAAWQELAVSTELQGLRLVELPVSVGDVVRKGQLLARFDDQTVQAELKQASAAVNEAETAYREAKDNANRARQVDKTGAMSAQQVSQFLAQEQMADARRQTARAQLQTVQLRLARTRVLAPDSGVISARPATLGSVGQPGVELVRLVRQSRLEWRADVTAAESVRVRPGQTARLAGPDGTVQTGTVRQVSPVVDAQSRNVQVFIDIPSTDPALGKLKPGMFAKGELQVGTRTTLTLPGSAIVLRDGFAHVFVLQAKNRIHLQRVQAGQQLSGRVEVSGLPATSQVVASGGGFLNDGDTVKVVTR